MAGKQGNAITFHPVAMEELQAAFGWYRERSPQAAHAFWQEIETGIGHIADAPARCPAYILASRRYVLTRFPYFIIFREANGGIEIIAVAHGRRKPGYWRKRLA